MPQVMSLLAVFKVMHLLQGVKRGIVSAGLLGEAIQEHLRLFVLAYGEDNCRPKHHYALHLAGMLKFFGTLISTFVHERKHRLVKRYTRDRSNLKNWDLSALEEITCHIIWELSSPFMRSGMFHRHKVSRRTLGVLQEMFPGVAAGDFSAAADATVEDGSVHVGDLVIFEAEACLCFGELLCMFHVKDECFAVASKWKLLDSSARGPHDVTFVRLNVCDDPMLVPLTCVRCALIHRLSNDGSAASAYVPLGYSL